MTLTAPEHEPSTRLLYKVEDAARLLSMSRTVIYDQMRTGRLHSIKQGRARLISADAINEYIDLLKQEAGEGK